MTAKHRLIPPISRRNVLRTCVVFVALMAMALVLIPRAGQPPSEMQVALTDGTGTGTVSTDSTGGGDPASLGTATDGLDDKGQANGTSSGSSSSSTANAQAQPNVGTDGTGGTVQPMPRVAPDGSACVDQPAEEIARTQDTVTVKEPIHACGSPYFPTKSAIGARDGTGQLLRSPTGYAYEPMPENPDTENDTSGRKAGTANPATAATGAACSTVLDSVEVADTVAEAGNNIIKSTGFDGQVLGKGSRTIGTSDHPAGYAIDFMVLSDTAEGNKIRDYVMKDLDGLNALYVIYRQTYYNHRGSSHMEDRGSPTANHFDHVHVSFKRTAPTQPITC